MRITVENISAYIQYLYQKKYNANAPQDLLDRWKSLPNDQINGQLNALYQHWQMTDQEVAEMLNGFSLQQGFIPSSIPVAVTPSPKQSPPVTPAKPRYESTPTPNQDTYPSPPQNNSNMWKIVTILLLAIMVAAAIFYFLKDDNNSSQVANDSSILKNNAPEEVPVVNKQEELTPNTIQGKQIDTQKAISDVRAPIVEDVEVEIAARTKAIKNLLSSEVDRDVNGILDKFANQPQQYWDMKNPTSLQIRDAYIRTWSRVDDIQYKNINVKRVKKNVYDLYADYSFYSIKDDAYKKVSVQTRYEFNDNGQIIKTYGINQN